jgi:hypothetical protein
MEMIRRSVASPSSRPIPEQFATPDLLLGSRALGGAAEGREVARRVGAVEAALGLLEASEVDGENAGGPVYSQLAMRQHVHAD